MDKVLVLLANTTTEPGLSKLRNELLKEEAQLAKMMPASDDIFTSILDPATHSMGYAILLGARISTSKYDTQRFISIAQNFFLRCSNQIRLVPGKVSQIARRYTEHLVENQNPIQGIKALRAVIKKLRPDSETLTAVHGMFLQLCLLAKCYSVAEAILNEEIYEINTENGLTPRDVLLYYYYGAMVFIGLKKYTRALSFLRTGLSLPAVVMSAIMAEGFKKYVLVSLLVGGKVSPLPKYTSSVMLRHQRSSFAAYQELAQAFERGSGEDLNKVVAAHQALWERDRNVGLIAQVHRALARRNVQRLTVTYITIALADIPSPLPMPLPSQTQTTNNNNNSSNSSTGTTTAATTSAPPAAATNNNNNNANKPRDTQALIMRMIDNKEIFARIDAVTGMLAFQENPEGFGSGGAARSLDQAVQRAIALGLKIRNTDQNISSSPSYLQRALMAEQRGKMSGALGFMMGMMGGPFGGFEDDFEDRMHPGGRMG